MFPKDIADSMRDCLLAIFWRKVDILLFFKSNNCTSEDLKSIDNTNEISRIQIIDTIFSHLRAKTDGGLGQFRCMLKSLIEWNSFDSYFFVEGKLSKDDAIRKINHLKQLQEIRDENFKKEKEHRKKKQQELEEDADKKDIKKIFNELQRGKDESGKEIGTQKRGYLFETFLKLIATKERLIGIGDDKFSVSLKGEQIDGRIKFEGENYVIEAKWQDKYMATNSLYQFAHKIQGKMLGRGIFISINGFSDDSVLAVSTGKSVNMVLFDGEDMVLISEGFYTFKEMLDVKVRAAQTMGLIYVDVRTEKSKIKT